MRRWAGERELVDRITAALVDNPYVQGWGRAVNAGLRPLDLRLASGEELAAGMAANVGERYRADGLRTGPMTLEGLDQVDPTGGLRRRAAEKLDAAVDALVTDGRAAASSLSRAQPQLDVREVAAQLAYNSALAGGLSEEQMRRALSMSPRPAPVSEPMRWVHAVTANAPAAYVGGAALGAGGVLGGMALYRSGVENEWWPAVGATGEG